MRAGRPVILAPEGETAYKQFMGAANNDTKIHLKVEASSKDNNDGLHQPHDANGKALNWNKDTKTFDGTPAYIKDSNGNLAYKEATITLYTNNITEDANFFKSDLGFSKMTVGIMMTSTFSHEMEHDLNSGDIKSIQDRQQGNEDGRDPEAAATAIGRKVIGEALYNAGQK